MSLRAVWAGFLLAAAAWAGGPKGPGTGSMSNELVDIQATVYLGKEQVKQVLGSDLDGHYIVVAVEVTPKYGKDLNVSRDDFVLRTDKDGEKSTPFAPSQIAGRSVLVISQVSGGGGGVVGEGNGPVIPNYPDGGPPRRLGGDGGGIGNVGGVEETQVKSGVEKNANPIMKVLKEKILSEGKTTQPVSGLLYFPMEKQKMKDLELIYESPEGKLRIRFREDKS